jgi:hypothetical protein
VQGAALSELMNARHAATTTTEEDREIARAKKQRVIEYARTHA